MAVFSSSFFFWTIISFWSFVIFLTLYIRKKNFTPWEFKEAWSRKNFMKIISEIEQKCNIVLFPLQNCSNSNSCDIFLDWEAWTWKIEFLMTEIYENGNFFELNFLHCNSVLKINIFLYQKGLYMIKILKLFKITFCEK